MDLIIEGLYLGDVYDSEDDRVLLRNGVTHIINATRECPNRNQDEFKYLKLGYDDNYDNNIGESFEKCHTFICEAEDEGGSVFVHCQQGISRSASVVISYLMIQRKITFKEACKICKDSRSVVAPNPGFTLQLLELEKKLLPELKGKPSISFEKYMADYVRFEYSRCSFFEEDELVRMFGECKMDIEKVMNVVSEVIKVNKEREKEEEKKE